MGNFNLTITNEGAAFLANVIANQGTINFSEVRFSSTNYVGSEAGLTEGTFGGTFITAIPSASVLDGTTINVAAAFTNATFATDKELYSIGVIANDGNGTDYLVAVATTSTPDPLSKFVGAASTYAYNINLAVSSTDNITVTASTAGAVFVADIVDNLTSSATNKPLSAKQGQVLKNMINTSTSAANITYDNTRSELSSDRVQGAIDELANKFLMLMNNFIAKNTVFNADGSITETDAAGHIHDIVFTSTTVITETLKDSNNTLLATKTTTFNNDGSITEAITLPT